MATILITGATGTVGSSLASSLESKGHRLIYLVRPKNGQNIEERLSEALGFGAIGNRIICEGDIVLPNCGVKESEIQTWKGKIDKVIHCASSISFDEVQKKQTFSVNVDGTNNILNLAVALEIPEFHHISTAYVAGDADYFTETDFDIGQTCRNPYERSKLEAEKLVKKEFPKRYSIYRLGIVVGDTDTGYMSSFNGYYGFLGSVWYLKQIFASMRGTKKEKYEANGIGFNSDGMLVLPIWGNFSPVSTLNIVPIDWVVKAVSNLTEVPASGKVFHVVHPQPPKVRWLNDVSLKHLGISGFRYGFPSEYNPRSLFGKFQRIFDRSTAQYLPYITHEAKFEIVNMPCALGRNYVSSPDVDETFVTRVMDYAKSVNFGKKEKVKV